MDRYERNIENLTKSRDFSGSDLAEKIAVLVNGLDKSYLKLYSQRVCWWIHLCVETDAVEMRT